MEVKKILFDCDVMNPLLNARPRLLTPSQINDAKYHDCRPTSFGEVKVHIHTCTCTDIIVFFIEFGIIVMSLIPL